MSTIRRKDYMQSTNIVNGAPVAGIKFGRYYSLLFSILAINPLFWFVFRQSISAQQPYLYIPMVLANGLLIYLGVQGVKMGGVSNFSPFVQKIWWLIILWGGFTVLRDFQCNIPALKGLLGFQGGAGIWLAPVAMLAGAQPAFWTRIWKTFVFHTKIGVLATVVCTIGWFYNYEISAVRIGGSPFLYAAGFLMICSPLRSKDVRLWALVGLLMSSFQGFLIASRHVILGRINQLLLFIVNYIFTRRVQNIYKCVMVMTIVIFAVCSFWIVSMVDMPKALEKPIFLLQEKLYENSRAGFFNDFFDSMDGSSVLFGRGVSGRYHSNLVNINFYTGRSEIECGYLHVILKGGIVMLFFFLLLTVPAVFLGVFASRNWFVRGCGLFVFARLFAMVPYGVPKFRGDYILFWLAVGVCLSIRIRKMEHKKSFRSLFNLDWI